MVDAERSDLCIVDPRSCNPRRRYEIPPNGEEANALSDEHNRGGFRPGLHLSQGLLERSRAAGPDLWARNDADEFVDAGPWEGLWVITFGKGSDQFGRPRMKRAVGPVGVDEEVRVHAVHAPRPS